MALPYDQALSGSLKLLLQHFPSYVNVKLNAQNYMFWKKQFYSFLKACKLIDHITGKSSRPNPVIHNPDGTFHANPDYIAWEDTDDFLKSCLYSSVISSIFTHIHNLSTAMAIWEAIEKRFQSSSRAMIHQLRHRLQSRLSPYKLTLMR